MYIMRFPEVNSAKNSEIDDQNLGITERASGNHSTEVGLNPAMKNTYDKLAKSPDSVKSCQMHGFRARFRARAGW